MPNSSNSLSKPASEPTLTSTALSQTLIRLRRGGIRLALLAAASLGVVLTLAAVPSTTLHTVVIKQMQFDPAQLSVSAGDTIEWKNEDIYSHSVTANDGSIDSGLIDPGKSWKTTVTQTGTVGYHCRPHPNMIARLVVSGGATQQNREQISIAWKPPHSPHEIHPILVNFTAALLPLALLSDLLGRAFRVQSLSNAGFWMVLYEAVITPFTAAAGWWWKATSGSTLPARLISIHQWLGTAAVVLFLCLAVWRVGFYKRGVPPSTAYLSVAFVAVLALVYQGSLGGLMLFGP